MSAIMNIWPVQAAKARFSELLDACISEGPQLVTRRGTNAAVLIPISEWGRLSSVAKLSLKELLLSTDSRIEFELPARGHIKRRPIPDL